MGLSKDRKSFGKFLQSAREDKGVTQAAVATHFGDSSAQFISNVERGLATIPKSRMKDWAKMVGVPLATLIDHRISVEKQKIRKAMGHSNVKR